jgi:hypothetical protein
MVPDPNPGGSKTYGSDGSGFLSGSQTLNVTTFYLSDQNILTQNPTGQIAQSGLNYCLIFAYIKQHHWLSTFTVLNTYYDAPLCDTGVAGFTVT